MDDRKRALVMGKFKFLYQDDCEDLEAGDKFQLAVVQNKLLGPVKYCDKDGKDPAVLQIYGKEREPGEGFADPDIKIPGILDLFTVVWSNPFGEIFVDPDIKFFEFVDIQKYSGYNDGPKSPEFCQFYTNSKSKELDGFDSAIFWSAGMLHKHFKTCGVEKWDIEFRDLVPHYRNWREWTDQVHNKDPNAPKKRFSDNPYSGPASTSSQYNRHNPPTSNNNNLTSTPINKGATPVIHYNPAVIPPPMLAPPPPTVLSNPSPGQTLAVPLASTPTGAPVQVQLVTIPPDHPPGTPIVLPPPPPQTAPDPGPGPKFKYINPTMVNTSQPPPGYPPSTSEHKPSVLVNSPLPQSSWTSAVDDFLSRPKPKHTSGDSSSTAKTKSPARSPEQSRLKSPPSSTNKRINLVGKDLDSLRKELAARLAAKPAGKELSSLRKVKVGGKRTVTVVKQDEENGDKESPAKKRRIKVEDDNAGEKAKKEKQSKKFKPRAKILPPSPAEGNEVNELDISPEETIYKGEILEWKGSFGFITCDSIYGKIFVHRDDIAEGSETMEVGMAVTFQVLHQESSKVGAKAVNVKIIFT